MSERKPAKKRTAKQKANPPQPANNQETGLRVNWDSLRSLTKRPPQTIVQGTTREEDSRCLQLADTALRPEERRERNARSEVGRGGGSDANCITTGALR
jgi:hypothetical protein